MTASIPWLQSQQTVYKVKYPYGWYTLEGKSMQVVLLAILTPFRDWVLYKNHRLDQIFYRSYGDHVFLFGYRKW